MLNNHSPPVLFSAGAALVLAACSTKTNDTAQTNLAEDSRYTRAEADYSTPASNHQPRILDSKKESENPDPVPVSASARLQAAEGQNIAGTIKFDDTGTSVRAVATLQNAPPGIHGVHIHEQGDCSDIEGKSMGGHFAPNQHPHALPYETDARHLGDLGNIEVDQVGNGTLSIAIVGANMKPNDPHSLIGRAFVVHSGEDSGQAKQPAGESGQPIACGVIETD